MAEHTTLQVRFWSDSYHPERTLDLLNQASGFEVKAGDGEWRAAKSGATLADVAGWMIDRGLVVLDTALACQRKRPWRGLYVLTIGPATKH